MFLRRVCYNSLFLLPSLSPQKWATKFWKSFGLSINKSSSRCESHGNHCVVSKLWTLTSRLKMSLLSKELLKWSVLKKIFSQKESSGCIKAEQFGFDSYPNLNTLISQLCKMAILSKIHNYKGKVKVIWQCFGVKCCGKFSMIIPVKSVYFSRRFSFHVNRFCFSIVCSLKKKKKVVKDL